MYRSRKILQDAISSGRKPGFDRWLRPSPPGAMSKRDWSTTQEMPSLPRETDVVVIGGGHLGCQTLYHLAKLGVTNVVLLEQAKLTAGTTWHTAGLVWRLRPNDTDIQIIDVLIQQVKRLEEETGIDPGWINNGGLFVANNKERLNEYKRLMTVGKFFCIDSFVLSPEETKNLYPLMNVTDVYATLYSPGDGTVDPNGLCQAAVRYATKLGAKVLEGVRVVDVKTQDHTYGTKKVTQVLTSQGTINTANIVNCTGVWANKVAEMVGLKLPLIPMKHAYITTERIEGIENMPNLRDHDASVYLKLQGDALHVGGYELNPTILEKGVQQDFAFGLYELDWDVFGVNIDGAVNRVPAVERTGVKSTVCGPESFTPDHKPIMGEDPRVRGFFHGCGFNSAGMMLGAGSGMQLAKWVVNGRPDLDMSGYDVRRFCPHVSKRDGWIVERSHEAYAKNYSVVFPHDEPLAGRNAKKDALFEELRDAGCVYQERLGWERPGWFCKEAAPVVATVLPYDWYGAYGNVERAVEEDAYKRLLRMDYTFQHPPMHETIKEECLSTRRNAGLFNMSYFGKFFMSGKDAQAAADWIFTNRMDGPVGKTVYACMLNENAGIEADLTVSILNGEGGERLFYVAAAGGAAYHNYSHIVKALQDKGFNVRLEDKSTDYGLLSLQGPKARTILEELTDVKLDNESFPFSSNQLINVAGHQVLALRVSFVGELGWELHVPRESCVPVYRALMESGKKHGLVNAGYRAMDSLSIEKGYPHWHQEIKMEDTPLESGLMFTCKLKTDIDFLGRDALESQKKRGAVKKKVCLTLSPENKSICLLGLEAIYRNGSVVGYLRRADYAFHLDQPIGYGYIHHPNKEKITNGWLLEGSYEIDSMATRYPANLHLRTPFDAENKRLQGFY